MIKLVKAGLATLIAATSIAAAATPAAAREHGGYGGYGGGYSGYNYGGGYGGGYGGYGYRHDHDDAAPLIIGGILGLALIAAVASSHHAAPAQTDQAYDGGDNRSADAPQVNSHPDVCTQQRQVWDPNAGQYTTRSYRVAC